MKRLRHVARLNPPVTGLSATDRGDEVSFLPLESIWSDSRFDATRTILFSGGVQSYNPVAEGDLVVPKVSPTFAQGRTAIATGLTGGRALATSEVFVVRPCEADAARFLKYRLIAHDFLAHGKAAWFGVAGLKRISADFLLNVRIDPDAWQRRVGIADFLDRECVRIEALQTEVMRLAVALEEYTRARLDAAFEPTPEMLVTKLHRLLVERPSYGVLVPQHAEAGVPLARVGDLDALRRGLAPDFAYIPEDQSLEYRRTVVKPGDVLVSVVGSIDKAAVVPEYLAGANTARAVARLRPRDIDSYVLLAWTRSSHYIRQAQIATSADTAQPTLNMADLARFQIAVPAVPEQMRRLRAFVLSVMREQQLSEREIAAMLQRLGEYRDALIYEAVTGALDVSAMEETRMDESARAALEGGSQAVLSR